MQSVPLPIFYKDIDGCFREFNTAFEKFMGLGREELYGKTAFDVEPSELAITYHEKDIELIAHPGAIVYDSRIKSKEGQIRDVVIHKATIRNLTGNVTGVIGAIFDITGSQIPLPLASRPVTQSRHSISSQFSKLSLVQWAFD